MPQRNFSTTDEVNAKPVTPTGIQSSFLDAGEGTEEQAARVQSELEATQTDLSESFLAARGTFYRVPLRSGTGPGLYAVEGLSQFIENSRRDRNELIRRGKFDANFASPKEITSDMGDEQIRANQDFNESIASENARRSDQDRQTAIDKNTLGSTPVLIMGISIEQNDIVSAVSCLNNIKVFYTFGQAFGNVHIRGEMLLGPLGSIQSDGVRILSEFFNQQRVSNLKKTTTFSIAQTAYQMYLTGLTIGDVDREFHVLPFLLSGILVDPANQNSSLLNPANQVIATDAVTAMTASTVTTDQADTAQKQQPTTLTEDNSKAIDALLKADATTAPKYDQSKLTPEDQAKIKAANDAVIVAEQSGDPTAVAAAIKDRNTVIQSAVTKSNAGQQTPAAGNVQAAVKAVDNQGPLDIDVLSAAVQKDYQDRAKAARNPTVLSKPNQVQLPDITLPPRL